MGCTGSQSQRIDSNEMPNGAILSPMRRISRAAAPLALVAVICLSGCIRDTKAQKAKFVFAGITLPPAFHEHQLDSVPPEIASSTSFAALPVFVILVPERPAPPRRIVASAEPEPEPAKPAPIQISPQLSAEEISRLKGDTENDLHTARLNLNSVVGKQMNTFQQELADKVHSFMDQTRDAQTAADWIRARSLAEKARIVSVDLVRSF